MYLAIDLETTGLDPVKDRVLEVAAYILDEKLEMVADGFHARVFQTADVLKEAGALDMHLGTGLVHVDAENNLRVLEPCQLLYKVYERLEFYIRPWNKLILLGNSVHFDRGFLKVHFPAVEARLHYRHLDITSVKLAAGPMFKWPEPAKKHTADSDILNSIACARIARNAMQYFMMGYP